jgi:LmbE family N-acetylglucosaminyl deacetylase
MPVEPDQLLPGRVLVLSPHFDDEVLGCGGTLARLSDKQNLHVAYVTDGSASPRLDPSTAQQIDLRALRATESRQAMAELGVPEGNLHFLGIQEGQVAKGLQRLEHSLRALLDGIRPEHVLVPFRYDRHPDHLAVNRITRRLGQREFGFRMLEYFIYYRTRLLPGGDLRTYIHPSLLVQVEIDPVMARKRRALACFRTQVTTFVEGQNRPILSEELIEAFCREPEVFLRPDLLREGDRLFSVPLWYVQLAQTAEWRLKRWKYIAATEIAARHRRFRRQHARSMQ